MEGGTASAGGGAPASSGAPGGAQGSGTTTGSTARGAAGVTPGPASAPVRNGVGRAPALATKPATNGQAKPPVEGQHGAGGEGEAEFRHKGKYFVNGREMEREFSRSELDRLIQVGLSPEESFKSVKQAQAELAKERDKLRGIAEGLKVDPAAAIKALGGDPDDFARQRLEHLLKMEQMSPEGREAYELKARLKSEAEQREKAEGLLKQRQQEYEDAQEWARYEPGAKAAITEFGIPLEPWSLEFLCQVGDEMLDAGLSKDPREHAAESRRRLDLLADRYLGGMDVSRLKQVLGADKVKAIIADNVAAAKKQTFADMQNGVRDEDDEPSQKKQPEFVDEDSFMSFVRGRTKRR